jgi:hypothetical protein
VRDRLDGGDAAWRGGPETLETGLEVLAFALGKVIGECDNSRVVG